MDIFQNINLNLLHFLYRNTFHKEPSCIQSILFSYRKVEKRGNTILVYSQTHPLKYYIIHRSKSVNSRITI